MHFFAPGGCYAAGQVLLVIMSLERTDLFLEGFDRIVHLLHGFPVPPFKERNFGIGGISSGSLRLQIPYAGVQAGRIICGVQITFYF